MSFKKPDWNKPINIDWNKPITFRRAKADTAPDAEAEPAKSALDSLRNIDWNKPITFRRAKADTDGESQEEPTKSRLDSLRNIDWNKPITLRRPKPADAQGKPPQADTTVTSLTANLRPNASANADEGARKRGSSTDRPAHPERIGKYRIERELGRGATGTVYLAQDGFAGGKVAVKVAHPNLLADTQQARRYRQFLRNEAGLVGKLRHPHVVALLDADIDAELPYVVMEFVDGEPLDQYAEPDTLLPVAEVFDLAFKCCNALDYAQRQGLVHRDLKPANLLRPREGGVKLTDFGAAMAVNSQNTQLHGFVGSPAYMSPEQVREEEVTHQSDIYSLGVVLYQLLTGQLPFLGDTDFATVYKINYEEPTPPSVHRPDLPEGIDAILSRAMAKKPAERYANWLEFAEALAELGQLAGRAAQDVDETRLFRALRGMPFFADFPDPALWETMLLARRFRVAKGEKLMREGMPGESFYLLVDGEAAVERNGRELARVGPGVTLGEMVYLRPENRQRTATVTAITDLVVLKIRSEALHAASDNLRSRFDQAFIKLLVQRLDTAGRQLSALDAARTA